MKKVGIKVAHHPRFITLLPNAAPTTDPIYTTVLNKRVESTLRQKFVLMEKLQRLASRMVKVIRGLSYEDQLKQLNLFSIEQRLLHEDLIMAHNMFQGRLGVQLDDFFEATPGRDLRRHDFQLCHRQFN